MCPGCGLHPVILDDPEHNAFTFEERLCTVCKGQDVYGRVIAERDENAAPKDPKGQPLPWPAKQPRPSDGRHVHLRRMSDDEVQKRKQQARDKENGRRSRGRSPGSGQD